jgi:tRNA uridine 5-carbamoylmethylation protein Kti12
MKVINIFGGPCVGKTTQAHELFVYMKKNGYNVDLIPEYAKKMVYRNSIDILKKDQLYIFSKQVHEYRIRENSNVEYVISDSPLLLSSVYNDINNSESFPYFNELVRHEYDKYDNKNFFLRRETIYQKIGRAHTEEEANDIDGVVKEVIKNIDYLEFGLDNFIDNVIKNI